jgi:hypothetical protein
MNVVRELVTLLRYEVDESGLQRYQQAYKTVQDTIGQVSAAATQRMRDSVRRAGMSPSALAAGA